MSQNNNIAIFIIILSLFDHHEQNYYPAPRSGWWPKGDNLRQMCRMPVFYTYIWYEKSAI